MYGKIGKRIYKSRQANACVALLRYGCRVPWKIIFITRRLLPAALRRRRENRLYVLVKVQKAAFPNRYEHAGTEKMPTPLSIIEETICC